ncbi:MAG: SDR family oxidoreductase [Pseudomonadota bacterium]|nr:SDR family oxidoreductase [Pseudomonadota bacterium]
MTRLLDRVAFVSGAASGIGLATAKRFAAEGAILVLADRAADRLEEAAGALNARGDRHMSIAMDVTQETDWIATAEAIGTRFGKLDVLVNNAGYGNFRSIADTTLEAWRAIMAVNLDSVFMATKYLLPLLAKSGAGAIVNMSSIRGIVAGVNASSYSAAKAAVRLFTKCTALECAQLGNGVRANSIHPGHVETPLTAKAYADPVLAKEFLAHTPIGRFAKPDDIADAILFLASDESRYMTGAELVIDGGLTAR